MQKSDFKSTIIFSDGACSGNPGPGGYAAIVAEPEGHVYELGGKEAPTTNNRMEISGPLKALASLEAPYPHPIVIYTDSTYVIRGITQWIWGWRSKGWKNAEGKEVLNRDLWEKLAREVQRLKPQEISWKYVRGHTGNPGNERCDEISVEFAAGRWVELYDGPLINYETAVYDLPEDQPLPEMRPKKEKVQAHSYLSNLGGIVMRHANWGDCERRVKGQSGAKFKKALNLSDELDILKGWGVKPESVKD